MSTDLEPSDVQQTSVREENDPHLLDLANKKDVVLLAFIGSYVPRRYGPAIFADSSMSMRDEFNLEYVLTRIAKEYTSEPSKLYLLLNSHGGDMASAFKMAMAIRQSFDEITVFVPHVAVSGGTMLALTGNHIRMGMMSQLGPVDAQVRNKDGLTPAKSILTAETMVSKRLSMKGPGELSYLDKHFGESLDPIDLAKLTGVVNMGKMYLSSILTAVGYTYTEQSTILRELVFSLPTHDFVIQYELAKEIGIRVQNSDEDSEEWDLMRNWLMRYVGEAGDTHFISYVIPKKGGKS